MRQRPLCWLILLAVYSPWENKAKLLLIYTMKRKKEVFRNCNFP